MILSFVLGVAFQLPTPVQPQGTVRRDSVSVSSPRRSTRGKDIVFVRRDPTARDLVTAFKDARAKDLLARAREARTAQDAALTSYDVNAYQRISAGIGIARLGRDRLVFRTEHSGRVRWQRDVVMWIDVTGARTVLPGTPDIGEREAGKGIAEAGSDMLPVPYFPGYEALWTGSPDAVQNDIYDNAVVHPLSPGAEAYYTYRTGDSLTLTLPDHHVIRLRSIEIRPRETKWNLMVGTLWFDDASGQLVRAGYRFAAPMEIDAFVREQEPDAFDDVPAWIKPMIFPMRGQINAITIEYGLYGGGFWLPRARTAEGSGSASFMRVPFKVEQTFKYSSVNGLDSLPKIVVAEPTSVRAPDSLNAAQRRAWRDSVVAVRTAAARARRDSVRRGELRLIRSQCDTSEYRVSTRRRYGDTPMAVGSRTPCDFDKLAHSPDLPASIFDPTDELFDIKARDALIGESLKMGAQPPFTLNPRQLPRPNWSAGLRLMRFNRVEGISAGIDGSQTLGGGYSLTGVARVGVADRDPNFEGGLVRTNLSSSLYLTGYKRLVSVSDWGNPLSFGSSLSGALFGRDEGFYYRANGVELGGRTEQDSPIEWKLFAERARTANVETGFAIGGSNATPNVLATAGTYAGTSVRIRGQHGDNPNGFRVFSDLRVEAAAGPRDSTYGRGALDLTFTSGLAAVTLSGGSSVGALPSHRRWLLGGSRTVRGQSPDTAQAGNAYWLARAEVGKLIQGARPVVFSDVGWVGDRNRMRQAGRPLSGVGAGVSLLDGLFRFDVARGLFPRKQFRFDAYVEAVF
jgi:hypothetical protein